jgi:hypothetical protein
MGPEGDAKISNAVQRNSGNFKASGDGDVSYSQPSASKGMGAARQMPINSNAAQKLPKAIRESILKHPIDTSNMGNTGGSSILDEIGYTVPKQNVNETAGYEQHLPPQQQYYQQQYVPQPMAIDYNYIRSIVNECVQANMQKIKEELLNESSLKLVRLNGGNKIQLVDNKNNLYESTLTFKKNLNKA